MPTGNLLVNADCELKVCDFGLANTFEGKAVLFNFSNWGVVLTMERCEPINGICVSQISTA